MAIMQNVMLTLFFVFYTIILNPIYDASTNSNQINLANASRFLISNGFQSYLRAQYDEMEGFWIYVWGF